MRFPNLTTSTPRRKPPPVPSGTAEGIVITWAAPRAAFVLVPDGGIYDVELFGLRWWPRDGRVEYFGAWHSGTGEVCTWPASEIAFSEGAALRERAIRLRPLRALG